MIYSQLYDEARGVTVIILNIWTQWTEFKYWMKLFAFHITLMLLGKTLFYLFSHPAIGK